MASHGVGTSRAFLGVGAGQPTVYSPSATTSSAPSSPGFAVPGWDAKPADWPTTDCNYEALRNEMQTLFSRLGIAAPPQPAA
jgi:hypothetical protein